MPVQIDIFDFKCYNQLRNGEAFGDNLSEFTPNLVGNIGERVKVEFKANVAQSSNTEGVETWFVEPDPTVYEIVRSSGSFLDDGIQVGDQFNYFDDWEARKTGAAAGVFLAYVAFLSSDGKTLIFDTPTGTIPTVGNYSNAGIAFNQRVVDNYNSALFLRFGLIGNEETFNFISKTTGAPQVYYLGGMTSVDGETDAVSLGSIKDWQTGDVTVDPSNVDPGFFAAQYLITHEFILNPFYTLDLRAFINAGTIPGLLAGDSSIKYAAELEFRKTLTDTGSAKIESFANLEGFVGWYGENFNGLNNAYSVLSVAYEDAGTADPLDAININTSTKATVVVQGFTGLAPGYSCAVYLVKLPQSEEDYIGTETGLIENFILKSEVVSSPATTSANVTTSMDNVLGRLTIVYTVDYTTAQKLRLTTDDEYMLLVQVEDPAKAVGDSDRVMLKADLRNYVDVDFLAGFANVPKYDILQHGQELGDSGGLSPILSNEDGILLDAIFGLDSTKNVVLNAATLKLIAFNAATSESFELDEYAFNIGAFVESAGVQQIEVLTSRGYPLAAGDVFNIVKISTGAIDGDFQQYILQIGQKIKWQDSALNLGVDPVFFDAAEPNNNLNFKSSNYSDKESYQIKVALILNVTGVDDLGREVTGDFTNYGEDLLIKDYGESDDGVSGVIETFDLESGLSLAGGVLYNGKDTLFKATFQDAAAMQYGIHRIEPSGSQGDGILELSSVVSPAAVNLLKPLAGETLLAYALTGSELVTQCLIDGGAVQDGVSYKLSARAAKEPTVLANPFTFTVDTSEAGTGSEEFQIPFISTGTYDVTIDKGNGDPLIVVSTWDASETLLDFASTGAGVYEVKIYGLCKGWAFSGAGDRLKMSEVSNFGTLQPTTSGVFNGCSNLDITATDTLDLSQSITMVNFFKGCSSLVFNSSINNWDTSTITDMREAFNGASIFSQSITEWNVSNVTIMNSMFKSTSFNSDITDWNVSNVTDMAQMFSGNSSFNQAIGVWTTSSLIFTIQMFVGNTSFNQSLNSWDVSNVTQANRMFEGCSIYNQPMDLWNVSSMTTMELMFKGNTAFNQDITGWATTSLVNMGQVFHTCVNFNYNIGVWDVTSVSSMAFLFFGVTLPTVTWDAILVSIEAQAVNNTVTLSGGNSQYTIAGAGGTARAALIADHSWTISDGGGI